MNSACLRRQRWWPPGPTTSPMLAMCAPRPPGVAWPTAPMRLPAKRGAPPRYAAKLRSAKRVRAPNERMGCPTRGELAVLAKPAGRGSLAILAALVPEFVAVTDEPKFKAFIGKPKGVGV